MFDVGTRVIFVPILVKQWMTELMAVDLAW